MFDIQTSPRTGLLLNDISPKGSWENRRYALLTQTLSQAGMKRMERGMVGWRYAVKKKKKFSVSSTQGSISLLEESTQPTENLFRHC